MAILTHKDRMINMKKVVNVYHNGDSVFLQYKSGAFEVIRCMNEDNASRLEGYLKMFKHYRGDLIIYEYHETEGFPVIDYKFNPRYTYE